MTRLPSETVTTQERIDTLREKLHELYRDSNRTSAVVRQIEQIAAEIKHLQDNA